MRAFLSGLFQFIVVTGTALGVLMAADGVSAFADIAETQYAVAVIGGAVAAAKDIQSRIALPRLKQPTL